MSDWRRNMEAMLLEIGISHAPMRFYGPPRPSVAKKSAPHRVPYINLREQRDSPYGYHRWPDPKPVNGRIRMW